MRILIYSILTVLIVSSLIWLKFYLDLNQDIIRYYERLALSASDRIEMLWVKRVPQHTMASWYDYGLEGDPDYSKHNLTAATWLYPRGTCLIVTRVNDEKGKAIVVRVNDYGPLVAGVAIDLSSYAFEQLAPLSLGVIEVSISKLHNYCE